MNRFLRNVKGASVALGVGLLILSSAPALAQTGDYQVGSPSALTSTDIVFRIVNNDTFDLLSIRFDLGNTHALLGSVPLVFDAGTGVFNTSNNGIGSINLDTPADPTKFGFTFSGFNTGDSIQFSWDPDIVGNSGYGAIVSELVGTIVLLETAGGNVNGVLAVSSTGQGDRLLSVIPSPIPEPEIYAMMLAGLGLMGFVARRRKQQAAAA